MGGPKSIEKKNRRGKLNARERIDLLFDPSTFMEVDELVKHRCTFFGMEGKEIPADAVVTGNGKILGRNAFVASEDFTVVAGTFGEMHGKKICKVIDSAGKCGSPFVQIIDSEVIRQITLLLGSCGGRAAYDPALTNFSYKMVDGISRMYIGGSAFVKTSLVMIRQRKNLVGPNFTAR
ncbi:MAG: carboxyl transferase domain-containing protein [Thermodesulfobacteriota bacterium]|nr:carboxyl transferase domain-containing protein [Thermodesulfobacteriota bacterium]